ncbi:hypothetical protein [Paraburkholderia sp. SIMBA_054]|uniref:hypothetical protein n=1 Tax=Paraburkholderia sp. SIMBA_054 TaxID=3085795 RepID=UPI00397C103C
MNIGIFPGWLLVAVIAHELGDVPIDLCLATAAVGIGLTMTAVTRSTTFLANTCTPLVLMAVRFLVLPELAGQLAHNEGVVVDLSNWFASASGLIVISGLSIVASASLGLRWVHTG